MKKFSVICGLALAMLAAGCAKDATTDINPIVKTTLSVSLDETRTYLGSAVDGVSPILWSEGDAVAVNGASVAVPAKYVGQAAAAFEGVTAAEEYSVFYPASLLDETSYDKNVYTIPVVQPFVEGSFAPNTSILVGYSENESVSLKNVYGYLKITLTNAANVNKVYVSATANEAISGTFKVDYENATVTPLAGESIIRVMGVQATSGTATVIVAIPAGEYAQGFTVKALDKNHYSMTKTVGKSAGVEIVRAQLYALPSLAYEASVAEEVEITTAEELDAFLIDVVGGDYSQWVNANGEVVLGNDIDLEGYELTTDVTLPAECVFNGQGYALKNWNITAALFADNKGTIKNLVLDNSCVWNLPWNGDTAALVLKNNGLVSGIVSNVDVDMNVDFAGTVTFATIVARSYNLVKDCVNNGNIEVSFNSWTTGNLYAGTVVAYAYKADKYKVTGSDNIFAQNCINNGNVTFKSLPTDTAGRQCYAGGVIGGTSNADVTDIQTNSLHSGTISGCINNGNIYFSRGFNGSGSYSKMGGVTGYAICNVVNCENYGNLTIVNPIDNAAGMTAVSYGGVVAYCAYNVSGCNNYGTVSITGCFASGGTETTDGTGLIGNPGFGGVIGQHGNLNADSSASISDCSNYGQLIVNASMVATNNTASHNGGVVGVTNHSVTRCYNYGDLTISHRARTNYAGGVIGRLYSNNNHSITYCENSGSITVNAPYSELSDTSTNATWNLGGVIGCTTHHATINHCHNSGNGISMAAAYKMGYLGGVAGYIGNGCSISNGSNSAPMTCANTNSQTYFGGIVGLANDAANIIGCDNSANLTVAAGFTARSTNNYVAGIVGQLDGATYSREIDAETVTYTALIEDCHNYNPIVINSATKWRTGGIAGATNSATVDCTNSGDLTSNSNDTGSVGGIVGFGQGNVDGCTSIAALSTSSTTPIGGLVGSHGNTTQKCNGSTVGGSLTGGSSQGIIYGANTATNAGKSSTIGDTAACKVKRSFTINGVQVTADDMEDFLKLWGAITTDTLAILGLEGVVLVD